MFLSPRCRRLKKFSCVLRRVGPEKVSFGPKRRLTGKEKSEFCSLNSKNWICKKWPYGSNAILRKEPRPVCLIDLFALYFLFFQLGFVCICRHGIRFGVFDYNAYYWSAQPPGNYDPVMFGNSQLCFYANLFGSVLFLTVFHLVQWSIWSLNYFLLCFAFSLFIDFRYVTRWQRSSMWQWIGV